MSLPDADGIPTISLLYRLKKLVAPDAIGHTLPEPSQSLNDRIGIIRGDITKLHVDSIVNAANRRLLGGGGVDGAIHRAAGRELLEECETLGGCETGSAKITNGYKLPCKKIIHAVGPVYGMQSNEKSAELLAGCYSTSLKLAVENECRSIAFSCLSTGVYGYPSMEAASVAIRTVKEFLEADTEEHLEKVVFCTFVQKDVDAYDELLPEYFPPTQYDLKGEEWEEVEGGESAENGLSQVATEEAGAGESQAVVGKAHPEDMPDVPTKEPSDDGPAAKKVKSSPDDSG